MFSPILLGLLLLGDSYAALKDDEGIVEDVPQLIELADPDPSLLETSGRTAMMSSMMERIRNLAHQHSSRNRGTQRFDPSPHLRRRPNPIPQGSHLGPAAGITLNPGSNLDISPFAHPLFLDKRRLDVYDYKKIWLAMLHDTHKIMSDESLLDDTEFSAKVLKKLFHLLREITLFDKDTDEDGKPKDHLCPYGYDDSGTLCLSSDPPDPPVGSYDEAREYCQLKGGDLAIIRDACELREVWLYLHQDADPGRLYSYWLGADDYGADGVLKWLDGSNVKLGRPFFLKIDSPFEDYLELQDTLNFPDALYLDVESDWFMNIKQYNISVDTLPLCQYIKARDGSLSVRFKPTGIGPLAAWTSSAASDLQQISQQFAASEGGFQGGGGGSGLTSKGKGQKGFFRGKRDTDESEIPAEILRKIPADSGS